MKNVLLFVVLCAGVCLAQEPQHSHDHMEAVHRHGEKAMGFSQTETTHHFRLTEQGGVVEVTANDAKDTSTQDKVRMHLQHIAQAFKSGDFSAPQETHQQTPPGVAGMIALKDQINYKYEEIPAGGRVVISTSDPKALHAVHDFLTFQIKDHQTGDPVEVQK